MKGFSPLNRFIKENVEVRQEEQHLRIEQIELLIGAESREVCGPQEHELATEARRHLESCETCQKLLSIHKEADLAIRHLRENGPDDRTSDCPSDTNLEELAAGILDSAEADKLLDHLVQCQHCIGFLCEATRLFSDETLAEETKVIRELRSSNTEWQKKLSAKLARKVLLTSEPNQGKNSQLAGTSLWLRWAFAGASLTVLLVSGWWVAKKYQIHSETALLLQAYSESRNLEMRFEGAAYAPLRELKGVERTQSRMSRPSSLLEAEASIAKKIKIHPSDTVLLDQQGRADLLEGNYETAVEVLEKAARSSPDNANVAIDLANAYFMRAGVANRPADYGAAVDTLGRVLSAHPDSSVARFNRAIALERMFLYQEAIEEWKAYLRLDSTSAWATEARDRLTQLQERLRKQRERGSSPLKNAAEFVLATNDPDSANFIELDAAIERYQDVALTEWLPNSLIVGARGPNDAETSRQAVQALGHLLETLHQDTWLAELVSTVRLTPTNKESMEKLFSAIRLNETSDRDEARRLALAAVKSFGQNGYPAGALRADFETIYAEQLIHQNEDCYEASQKLLSKKEIQAYAWIHIQALLESAVCSSLSDDRALRFAKEARDLAKLHHYKILEMRAITFLSGLSWSVGDFNSAWRYASEGLRQFWEGDYPQIRGYNLLTCLDVLSEDEQRWFLQLAVSREATLMIQDDADFSLRAFAQSRLAQTLLMTGDLLGAESNFLGAQKLFSNSSEGSRRQNLQAETEIGLANVQMRRGQYKEAISTLEAADETIRQIRDKDLQLSFFQSLGLAQMNAGDSLAAQESLQQAVYLADEGLEFVKSERMRLEWSRKNDPTYRALVRLKFSMDPAEALGLWEWYKGAPLRKGKQPGYTPESKAIRRLGRLVSNALVDTDSALVSFAVLDRGTVVWVYNTMGIRGLWLDLPRKKVELLAQQFGEHCSDPKSNLGDLSEEGAELYRLLFVPIEPLIRDAKHLIIEPDGALDLIPFEALVNKNRSYFGDVHSITLSTGLQYLADGIPWSGVSKSSSILIVGDPSARNWQPLRAARIEAQAVADLFVRPQLLLGEAATYPAISHDLPRVEIFHFSGHAVASPGFVGAKLGGTEYLDVGNLEGLSSPRNKLVVLSACETAEGANGTFNDPQSLARSFIGSGVPEVVASRWAVDAESTSVLMKEFYGRLLSGVSPSDSLHGAAAHVREQAGMAHPFFWAGFAVFGRS
jgi:CHAT domain-containing protein/cytochrome c-type biogenesis protein CcmH/NrfG